uniref:Peptide/nickel transport system ATP-binding protein n=1 Tax=uncultured Chloroflexota bacterium TaxID=166587 RepID=H5SN46_9CHLR|nr:peptide/nickel transport system ATP-binding protein [uncultured Chloroflexota bacterium]
MSAPLLQVSNLRKYFQETTSSLRHYLPGRRRVVKAVDGVSLTLQPQETLGIVGESGCGKSTLGRTILRLLEPTAGQIIFKGQDITHLPQARLRPLRQHMQIVYQNPFSSLNPRKRVEAILRQPLEVHGFKGNLTERVEELLQAVGLPAEARHKYPHQFSGGQQQRIAIARALATHPEFIVADEVTSALDVSIQAQIINLMARLQQEFGLAYLFISHNLGVIKHISHRIAVMYLGQIVEQAATETLFAHPRHPYTQILMSAIPTPNVEVNWQPQLLVGDVPSPVNLPSGCRFHPRCPIALAECAQQEPELRQVAEGHWVACHLA